MSANKQYSSKQKVTASKAQSINLLTLFPDYRKKMYLTKDKDRRDKCLQELREAYMHKGLVLYGGAGISRSVGLPTWPELIRRLTVNMMTRKGETAIQALGNVPDEKVWDFLSAIQSDFEKGTEVDKPILMMARAIKDELGSRRMPYVLARTLYPMKFRMWLRHNTPRPDMKARPTRPQSKRVGPRPLPTSPLLDVLVCLARAERDVKGVQAIVNYNYDDILDEKLREQNVRCVTVRSGRDKVQSGVLPCYHVHGVLPLKHLYKSQAFEKSETIGNFVFSEDEYHAEYSDPYRWSNMTQISLLGRYTGLFVGLSMEDPNIRRLIDVTHRQYPEIKNYAILPRQFSLGDSSDSKARVLRNLFEDVETRSFLKIGVNVIWVDSHDDIPKFIKSICEEEKT